MINQTVSLTHLIQGPKEAYLVPLNGGTPHLIEGVLTLGRSPENDVILHDPHISAQHCQLEKRPHGYFLRDLSSRNGVLINGSRVFEGQLLDGFHIQIGNTSFVFQTGTIPSSESEGPLKSKNPHWSQRLASLKNLSQSSHAIFLKGESGTGKEILAHVIHDLSPRCEKPIISVNCSALTESLVESELFGHTRGSFTGATSDRKGAFETARGGTLFLDEIGDLPPALQPKLLRALENQEIRPVGSDKIIKTDVRIITATHKNIEHLVKEGKFREDLYFRINVIKISIPCLRERMEDFEDIFYHFAREFKVRFSVGAIAKLKEYKWPGNIRELRNTIARASAIFPQTYVQPEHVATLIDIPSQPPLSAMSQITVENYHGGSDQQELPILKKIERDLIKARLLANNGNQRKTAAELGIPKSTLHDRIKNYRIELNSLVDLNGFKENSLNSSIIKEPV